MDDKLSVFGKTLHAFKAKADVWQGSSDRSQKGRHPLKCFGVSILPKPIWWVISHCQSKLWDWQLVILQKWSVFPLCIKTMFVADILMVWQGELQHKYSKSAYANSNKGPDKDFQIARRAFQRHKIDAIRQANKLSRRSGHDLQRPTEKMHLLNSDRKTRMRAPRGYSIQKLLWDMGGDSSCTVSHWLYLRLYTVIDVIFTAI